jgi:indolepyruvate ferredoxin oxidoreductase alpha subunit
LATKLITGNTALALGALRAGVKVVTGYPGTPSTGALTSLLAMELPERVHVEWSANEKVAFEIAAGAAWAGQRALCTMKMSGVNVAFDSLISVAYSGCVGGLVIYVADDPGVSAGMAEQDSRSFALMADLPMLEPASVAETYQVIQAAFDLSERAETPVFVRLVTAIAQSKAAVPVEEPLPPPEREPKLWRDITRFTKAGSAICMQQHRDLIARLEKAGEIITEMGLNQLRLAPAGMETRPTNPPSPTSPLRAERRNLGIIASGVTASYLEEGIEVAAQLWAGTRVFDKNRVSVLKVVATNPFPTPEVQALLRHCDTILVLEELEPHLERRVVVQAHRLGFGGPIVGKLDGPFSRIGEYGVSQVVQGIGAALDLPVPDDVFRGNEVAATLAAARPITVCAGCPHRGTFMAINQAIKKAGFKKDEVMVTGDIGCTILGMNPPFHTVWNEVAMGASIGIAQGYVHAGIPTPSGVPTPVIATIGDSTFFHAGIPSLVNAVQHQVPLTLIIMDNGWTSMTGMQVNPGTAEPFQRSGDRRLDIAEIVPALGVEHFSVIDPFDLDQATAVIQEALALPGVKVVLAREECAIQARRHGHQAGQVRSIPENCVLCKRCIRVTGCPAISIGEQSTVIDPTICYGCGLCAQVCPHEALVQESAE